MKADEMIVRLLMDANKLAAAQLSITLAGGGVNNNLQGIAFGAIEQTSETLEEIKEAAGYE